MKIGLTVPSFVDDPDIPLRVARAAEESGVHGVFVFEHVFRGAIENPRPALECYALLGAIAAETSTVTVGTLVSRATLRPAESLAAALQTAQRIAGPRLVATIGSGDAQSRDENESYGLDFGSLDDRVAALDAAVDAAMRAGVPVWVGGTHPRVRAVAARADGWNRWGGDVERFAREAAAVRAAASRPFSCSWGGLVVLDHDHESALRRAETLGAGAQTIVGSADTVVERLRPYEDAGADWVILGAVDASDPRTARLLGEQVVPALSS